MTDREIADQVSLVVDLLRSAARRWRSRADAGRIESHSLEQVLIGISLFEEAASTLESATTAGESDEVLAAMGITEELRRSEERFRLLVDKVRDYAIFMLDPDGRVASWNEGAERLKGYTADEILGKHVSQFYTPEDRANQRAEENLRLASVHGRAHDEGWRVRKDGTLFWAEIAITALRDAEGELLGYAKVTRDLTERMQAERALRESEERFRLLVQRVQDYAIFMLDPDGHIVSWNEGAARIKGYSTEEILGKHFSVFYGPEDLRSGKPARALAMATQEGRFEEENWRIRKDGTAFWADVVLTALRDETGELRGFAKVTRDLTDRKRAEDARRLLYESTVVLASAFDLRDTLDRISNLAVPQLADWCLVDLVDEGGVIRQISAAHANPDLAERAQEFARRNPPDPRMEHGVAHVIRTGRPEVYPHPLDATWRGAPVGEDHPRMLAELGARSYVCVPLFARGRVLGAITYVRAESGGRYTAEEMRDAEELGRWAGLMLDNARLYEEAQAAVAEQRATAERLRESDRRKDEFLAMLGHELRNPLAAIRSATELMRVIERGDARLQRAYNVLDRQTVHMTRLVDGLLEVSRIARGKIELDRELLDLRQTVAEVLQTRAADIDRRGLQIVRELPSSPVWVSGDPVRIVQVFDNIVGNAVKFTDSPGRIIVSVEAGDEEAVVRIRDTGRGIRPESLDRIFEPFQQESQDVARITGGLGLGLALARGLVELHGGRVVAHSEGLGAGAEFRITLPTARAPEAPHPDEGWIEVPPRRILLVEDNADAAAMLGDLLRARGHDVTVVDNGPEALDLLRRSRADVVLCDIGLPGWSGYDLARAVRADPVLQGIDLVALTGYGQPEDRRRSTEAGFDEHLVKPVDLPRLEAILSRLEPAR